MGSKFFLASGPQKNGDGSMDLKMETFRSTQKLSFQFSPILVCMSKVSFWESDVYIMI